MDRHPTLHYFFVALIVTALLAFYTLKKILFRRRPCLLAPKTTEISSGKILLIIDGCNGPIRLDRDLFLDSRSMSQSISLLQVVNGENRFSRIHLLQALDKFMRSKPGWQAQIYFDGLGVDKYHKWGMTGREWNWTDLVGVKVTPIREEADNLIVHDVQNRRSKNGIKEQELTLPAFFDTFRAHHRPVNDDQALVFQRDINGPGRSRQVLKRFGLMRPESVFCLFSILNSLPRDIKSLQSIRHHLSNKVVQQSMMSQTVVATDDIFLRQRIVEASGLVMTFEQLWELLVPFS